MAEEVGDVDDETHKKLYLVYSDIAAVHERP